MLSKHPDRCKYPHGHTRTVEVIVSGDSLDGHGMLVDFKALKLAMNDYIERYDHAMAVNSNDPILPALRALYPEDAMVIFENQEPTTEAIAKDIYDFVEATLKAGFHQGQYTIEPDRVQIERIRVWETPSSWAEYGA